MFYIYIYHIYISDQVIFELVKYFPNYLSLYYETLFADGFLKIDIFK